jgi:L-ascorbate metabolism protein UlaG (beta-lactamase superfamily)
MRIILFLLILAGVVSAQGKRPVDEIPTSAGPVKITIVNHASLVIEGGGVVIHIDPVGVSRYAGLPQADFILITHTHGDHMDPGAVASLKKPGAVVLAPEAVAKALSGATVMRNGEIRQAGKWSVEAVPAYNLKHGPSAGAVFHPKGEGNGYVLTFGGKRFYVAGDTEGTPEMAALKNIDVAFLPMNLPYTMTPEEAAAAARSFSPKIVYPYHDRGSDLAAFQKALQGSGIEVRIRDWYY